MNVMRDSLPIDEVVRRTGLTSRALRFYETKGLVSPLRTASDRRIYDSRSLSRLHQIVVLKSAGLSLAQMKLLFDGKTPDLYSFLSAQLKKVDEEADKIANSRRTIQFALAQLDLGEAVDPETFCALNETGGKIMNQEPKEWRAVTDCYFSPAQKGVWADAWGKLGSDFDHDSYNAQWKMLGDRIKAAMPMAPDSDTAQAFVDEWFELLKPFSAISTPEMWQASMKMYDDIDAWAGDGIGMADPGFNKAVWDFMKLATASRISSGWALPALGLLQKGV
jgi:MerR family transcriptional regulator, thiopeptide resistance regulator